MSDTVTLLSNTTHAAVVQIPGRKFPACAIQGDSLSILYHHAAELEALLYSRGEPEAQELATELRELLEVQLRRYDEVLKSQGIPRPYAAPKWRRDQGSA